MTTKKYDERNDRNERIDEHDEKAVTQHGEKDKPLEFLPACEAFEKAMRSRCHSAPEEPALLLQECYTGGHLTQGDYVVAKGLMSKKAAVQAGGPWEQSDAATIVTLTEKVNKKHD